METNDLRQVRYQLKRKLPEEQAQVRHAHKSRDMAIAEKTCPSETSRPEHEQDTGEEEQDKQH